MTSTPIESNHSQLAMTLSLHNLTLTSHPQAQAHPPQSELPANVHPASETAHQNEKRGIRSQLKGLLKAIKTAKAEGKLSGLLGKKSHGERSREQEMEPQDKGYEAEEREERLSSERESFDSRSNSSDDNGEGSDSPELEQRGREYPLNEHEERHSRANESDDADSSSSDEDDDNDHDSEQDNEDGEDSGGDDYDSD